MGIWFTAYPVSLTMPCKIYLMQKVRVIKQEQTENYMGIQAHNMQIKQSLWTTTSPICLHPAVNKLAFLFHYGRFWLQVLQELNSMHQIMFISLRYIRYMVLVENKIKKKNYRNIVTLWIWMNMGIDFHIKSCFHYICVIRCIYIYSKL